MQKAPKEKIEALVEREGEPIFEIESVFPFDLRPDKVLVYRNKVVVYRKSFPVGKKEFPILLKDIKTVRVFRGFILASMFIDVAGYETNPDPILSLNKSEAEKCRAVITGLLMAKKKNIDLTKINKEELIKNAKEIG